MTKNWKIELIIVPINFGVLRIVLRRSESLIKQNLLDIYLSVLLQCSN